MGNNVTCIPTNQGPGMATWRVRESRGKKALFNYVSSMSTMNVYSLDAQASSTFSLPQDESGVCVPKRYTDHQHFPIALLEQTGRENAERVQIWGDLDTIQGIWGGLQMVTHHPQYCLLTVCIQKFLSQKSPPPATHNINCVLNVCYWL